MTISDVSMRPGASMPVCQPLRAEALAEIDLGQYCRGDADVMDVSAYWRTDTSMSPSYAHRKPRSLGMLDVCIDSNPDTINAPVAVV
jgi:hypothetical protein